MMEFESQSIVGKSISLFVLLLILFRNEELIQTLRRYWRQCYCRRRTQ
ncbi:hypothetical protein LINPERPRIM_LOCUS6885 [Linum perenne]